MMTLAFLVVAAETAAAFLTLDMFFRYMTVEPARLRKRLRAYALSYSGIAVVVCGLGGFVQARTAGLPGLGTAALNWLPWWLLWRFGLRKQFTHLFKSDGGRPAEMGKTHP